jgi:murein DD-endopeptidase MepM/ murein hydrolase activator NlpD
MTWFRRADEFRAGRLNWLVFPILLLLAALILPALYRSVQQSPVVATTTEPAVEEAIESDADWVTVHDQVRRGDTFSGLLLRNRLGMQEIARVLDVTKRMNLFSPRQLQPGQTLTLERDDFGAMRRLSLCLSPEETYVYEPRGAELIAYLQPVEREMRLRKFEGRIAETVDDAIREAGGDYRLTLKFADVFAYDVDFLTEVHTGDRFSLLVEEKFVDGKFTGYGQVLYGRYDGRKAGGTAVWYRHAGAPRGGYYDLEGKALKKSFLRAPLNFRRISSQFSKARFHPIKKIWCPHHGVDYAAATGTPVVAVSDGTVTFSGWKSGYGKFVQIRHAGRTETAYGHLSRISPRVRVGARVEQGEVIGNVGQTGLATGPHLHYEVHQNGARIDPLALRNLPAEPIPAGESPAFQQFAQGLSSLESTLLAGQVLETFDPAELTAALAALTSDPSAGPADATVR